MNDSPEILVLGGMGRSGTTFMAEFINSFDDVVIYDELHLESIPSLFAIWTEINNYFVTPLQSWRGLDYKDISDFFLKLLLDTAKLGSRIEIRMKRGSKRGFKCPLVESKLSYLLSSTNITCRLIYNTRDPLEMYGSYLKFGWGNKSPCSFLRDFNRSLSNAISLILDDACAVYVIDYSDLPRAGLDNIKFRKITEDMKLFLDAIPSDKTYSMIDNPTHINSESDIDPSELSSKAIQELQKELEECISDNVEFAKTVSIFRELTQSNIEWTNRY